MIPDNPCRMSSDEAARRMWERANPFRANPRLAGQWLIAYRGAIESHEMTPSGRHCIYWLLPRDG